VAPVADAAALAGCVVNVATLPAAQRRTLGASQRERIVREFDIRQVWLQYLALYTRLADASAVGAAN
jgi:hypothetical protein